MLIIIFALDVSNSQITKSHARILVSSLLRTFCNGEILVFTNSESPLFFIPRKGVHEININERFDDIQKLSVFRDNLGKELTKYVNPNSFDSIAIIPPTSIVLRNLDHLFYGSQSKIIAERLFRNKPVFNSIWIAPGSVFHAIIQIISMEKPIEEVCEITSWGCLLNSHALSYSFFEGHEVQNPLEEDSNWSVYSSGCILTTASSNEDTLKFMYGMYMQNFYFEKTLLFLNTIES